MKLNLRNILLAIAAFITTLAGGAGGAALLDATQPEPERPDEFGIAIPIDPELIEVAALPDSATAQADAEATDADAPRRSLWLIDLIWEKTDSATPDTDRFRDQRYLIAVGWPSNQVIAASLKPYWEGYEVARVLNRTKVRELTKFTSDDDTGIQWKDEKE